MADIPNAVQRVMFLLADYTMADAREILQRVNTKLTTMETNQPNPRPPDPDKPPTTDTATTDTP